MMYSMSVLLILSLLSVAKGLIQDFRVGIQLCDGLFGQHAGEIRYTPWLINEGVNEDVNGWDEEDGWSDWASDINYRNPDGIRLGLSGQIGWGTGGTFQLDDVDLRLCVQLTDRSVNEDGNKYHEGEKQCTPWVSDGGGWSDWAADRNWRNYDAMRVKVEFRPYEGLMIKDVQIGLRGTDHKDRAKYMGQPQYTQWLIYGAMESTTWSNYAGDSNFRNPDSIKVYLRAEGSVRASVTPASSALSVGQMIDYEFGGHEEGFVGAESNTSSNFMVYAAAGCVVLNAMILAAVMYKRSGEPKAFN